MTTLREFFAPALANSRRMNGAQTLYHLMGGTGETVALGGFKADKPAPPGNPRQFTGQRHAEQYHMRLRHAMTDIVTAANRHKMANKKGKS